MKGKVEAAEQMVTGMYDRLSQQIGEHAARLDDVDWMLSQLAEATFQLLPTEGCVAAVKAVLCRTAEETRDDPQGVLFLTDQKLVFERKQEVATRKVLFITTDRKKVQEVMLEVPVALVEKVETARKGVLKNEDFINLFFQSGAPVGSAIFHIWKPGDEWQALINRARVKDFDKDRAVKIDQAEIDKVRAVPSQCPSCGGNIDQVILRGQESIKCKFCGYVIRL